MRTQTTWLVVTILVFGLLLAGCGLTAAQQAPLTAPGSELDLKEQDSGEVAPSLAATQSSAVPEREDDMENSTTEESAALPGIEIFNFGTGDPGWYTVDDRVMGGVSRSAVEVIESDVLRFAGTMSLESNGGFSSARSDWDRIDLDGYDGVLLRVLGDGNAYRLRIRTSETGSEVSYNGIFETSGDGWQIFYIPFDGMMPTYRGFLVDTGPLNPAAIGSFGFMLSDKQPGEFVLQVDWIRAVSERSLIDFKSN